MEFKKPFRAVPINPSARYAKRNGRGQSLGLASLPVVPVDAPLRVAPPTRSQGRRSISWVGILAAAALLGGAAGVASIVLPASDWAVVRGFAVDAGVMRTRVPQAGDYWSGCNSARAAGTAPIYRGEPEYRAEMDGDSDGIACEPYRGY